MNNRKIKRNWENMINKIKWWIMENVIKDDLIQEYVIDKQLLDDYYNSEPVDYYHDYD
jgi:hypothetical protein